MPITQRKTLAKARPNAHYVELISETWDDGETWFAVVTSDDDRFEFDDEDDARKEFDHQVWLYRDRPNWGAQAEYDAQWGEPLTPWWNER